MPGRARRYRIRIDDDKHTVEVSSMTGRELLTLAGKTPPESHRLIQKLKGGKAVPIGLDESADFTCPGVERFITFPCDQTEGDHAKALSTS